VSVSHPERRFKRRVGLLQGDRTVRATTLHLAMKTTETKTIVLIHGLWMTPHSWESFRRFFTGHQYDVHAPAWPRMGDSIEAIRRNPSALAGLGLREITEHYGRFIEKLDESPVLIGHSMGGLVVQMESAETSGESASKGRSDQQKELGIFTP
jgi:pimeloyl-ACP methyl ester carboxylesterase